MSRRLVPVFLLLASCPASLYVPDDPGETSTGEDPVGSSPSGIPTTADPDPTGTSTTGAGQDTGGDTGATHDGGDTYSAVELDVVAADAGVTVGSLYHHFRSKLTFYGVLRDEMTQRLLDRMEAAAEAVSRDAALKAAILAAYDGAVRLKVGRLITDPDPRALDDKLALYIGELVTQQQWAGASVLGHILTAAVRAALAQAGDAPEQQAMVRQALEHLLY